MSSSSNQEFNKRKHERTPLQAKIKIIHQSFGEMIVRTRDISMGGVYILTDQLEIPPPGTRIAGQIQDDYTDRPVVEMEVVRVEPEGVGLKFVD